jgi:uncharacterized protein (TIGR02246 family)
MNKVILFCVEEGALERSSAQVSKQALFECSGTRIAVKWVTVWRGSGMKGLFIMRTSWIITGLAYTGLLAAIAIAQVGNSGSAKDSSPPAQAAAKQATPGAAAPTVEEPSTAAQSADETAIRHVVDAFTKAYDAGDSKTIAALFTPEAEIVSQDGTIEQGRDAIESAFADEFKQYPKARIKVDIQSIRFVSPTLAIEEGTSVVTHDFGGPSEHTRYEVVHTKQSGAWQMASARDLPDEAATAEEQLDQLKWLIGDWVDEDPDDLVQTSYRWSVNHHFILCDFTVDLSGQPAMTGTQRIGWDPLSKTIRSWAFDSEGGFTEGIWSHEGNQWIIKTTGVTNDGKSASATNYLTRLHKHRLTWESRDRFIGGEKTDDIGPIAIARQPPTPGIVVKHSVGKHSASKDSASKDSEAKHSEPRK